MDSLPSERSKNFLYIPECVHYQYNSPALYSAVDVQCVCVNIHIFPACFCLLTDLKHLMLFHKFFTIHHNFSSKDIILTDSGLIPL